MLNVPDINLVTVRIIELNLILILIKQLECELKRCKFFVEECDTTSDLALRTIGIVHLHNRLGEVVVNKLQALPDIIGNLSLGPVIAKEASLTKARG